MKIGLYFGSFNPIHHGHLVIANFIRQHAHLDQVWFVVSPQNPLKRSATLLNEYHRLHLVRVAVEGTNELKASDIEFKLPKPSYTVDTLTYLQEKYPKDEFSIIMGSDSFQNLTKWKNHQWLVSHYPIYVYRRPEHETLPSYPDAKHIEIVDAPLMPISSTEIRHKIKKGQTVRYLLPDAVLEEIEKSGYYR
ncbi:MAG TPA: nicotinate (nicotinamide) nucleotide adenylyltransferase [Puia sp.]|nr:nicotinate (nicotinamide) nucleotide adenylyltransferase [Puia sp.]